MTRLTPAVLVLLLLACGDTVPSGGERANGPLEPSTRDSAGVTIHEHPADALERAPLITMDSVPMAVIGSDDVEDDVSAVSVLAILPDGRIAGFDGAAGAVRIYGTDGALQGSFGRRGEGPGEFRTVEQLVVMPGDTLLVADWVARRATLVHPDSGIIRLEAIPTRGYRQSFTVGGVLSGGEWLMVPTSTRLLHRTAGPEPDTTRAAMPMGVFRSGSGAESFDTILVQHGPPMVRFNQRVNGATEMMEGPQRHAPWPIAAAWHGRAIAIPNDGWKVLAYDASGALTTVVRFDRPRKHVTTEMKDSLILQQLEEYRKRLEERPEMAQYSGNPEEAEFNARNAPWADSLPPFSRAHPSAGTLLWLAEGQLSWTDSMRSLAIDPTGQVVGRLTTPGDLRLMAISDDRVILRHEDDDGIIRFAVHRLVMPQ